MIDETTELKNELIAKAQQRHKMAKGKKFKDVMDKGKAAKDKLYKTTKEKVRLIAYILCNYILRS